MIKHNFIKAILSFSLILVFLSSCEAVKYKKVSAKDYPPEPEKRVRKNLEEGRGFRLMGDNDKGGVFDFASSNPLWRASLDTINFLPLISMILDAKGAPIADPTIIKAVGNVARD